MIQVETATLARVLGDAIDYLQTYEAAKPMPVKVSAEVQALDMATQILAELRDLLNKSQTDHCSFAEPDIAAIRLERVRHALTGVTTERSQPPVELF